MQWSFLHLTLSSTSWAMAFSARPCHVKAFPYATTLFTGFQPWLPITASNHTQPRSYNILCKLCILIRNLSYVLSPQALVEHFNLIISQGFRLVRPRSPPDPWELFDQRFQLAGGEAAGCAPGDVPSHLSDEKYHGWLVMKWIIYTIIYIYIYTDRYVYTLYLGDWGLS